MVILHLPYSQIHTLF
ncbi:MAG TPA: hypothetical protein EYO99_02340 [Candidatus Marinimicrobia bacterium]|nr:hypothetical protein [Candidatus Neomarinimicrobiota bacterium]